MNKINIDNNWEYTIWNDNPIKQKPISVSLPHDWSVRQKRDASNPSGASGGFYPGCVLIYTKKLDIPLDDKDKQLIIEFEGAYMSAEVKVNNQIVTTNHYGYSTFHADITDYVNIGGKNTLKVIVSNGAHPNSRWYSGTGLYRHVWLLSGEKYAIAPWGIHITTPQVDKKKSLVEIETQFSCINDSLKEHHLHSTVISHTGKIVATSESIINIGKVSPNVCKQMIYVAEANLWSADTPYLYTLKSELIEDGKVIDIVKSAFGIRSIEVDSKNGLRINGDKVNLKGGCIHHGNGLLGAASYDRAEERKVELLKASGFNAVRCAHNTPSPAFLDACDRIGLYVIDETFDCWREGKNPYDYHTHFENDWKKDTRAMVIRDRNHPSIIMWSIGNEIAERGGMSEGYRLSYELSKYVRELDNTRLVTSALNNISADSNLTNLEANLIKDDPNFDVFGKTTKEFLKPLDIAGYNYLNNRYESDKDLFPERVICGAESFPLKAHDNWKAVTEFEHVIGDFVWTAIDYLGEAGIGHVWRDGEETFLGDYPWQHANCGDMDICGFKRPQSYYRDAVWGNTKTPYIAVEQPVHYKAPRDIAEWGWPDVSPIWDYSGYEGCDTHVEVYCAADEVELLLNNESFGRKTCASVANYKAEYTIPYSPGKLTAIGYANNKEISRHTIVTAGKMIGLSLQVDRSYLCSDIVDLSYITINAVDSDGNIVHRFSDEVKLTSQGVGEVLALGSGDPRSTQNYYDHKHKAFEGRLLGIIKSFGKTGELLITASCKGFESSTINLTIK